MKVKNTLTFATALLLPFLGLSQPNISIDFNTVEQVIHPKAVSYDISGYGSGSYITNDAVHRQRLRDLNGKLMRMDLGYKNPGDPSSPIVCGGAGCATGVNGDDWINAIKNIGGEPVVIVSVSSKYSLSQNVKDAVAMVRHFNKTTNNYIGRWLIGNEPDNGGYPGSLNVYDYSDRFNVMYDSLKAVDPTIKIGGPATAWYNKNFLDIFLTKCGSKTDFVDFHTYGQGGSNVKSDAKLLSDTREYKVNIDDLRNMIKSKVPGRASQIEIQVGEWNLDWDGDPKTYDHFNTVWSASALGNIISAGAIAMTYADKNGGLGMLYENDEAVRGAKRNDPLPIYHGLTMFTGGAYFDGFGSLLVSSSTTLPDIEVFSSDNPKRIVVINKHSSNTSNAVFDLNGYTSGAAEVWRKDKTVSPITGPSRLGGLSISGGTFSYSLPPYSVTVFLLSSSISANNDSVISFTLVNADTDADIQTLNNGDTINLNLLPTINLNVRANTKPSVVSSIVFGYDSNSNYYTENMAPYALAGDNNGDYHSWTPAAGIHMLTARPYSLTGGTGIPGKSLTISFTVIGKSGGNPPGLSNCFEEKNGLVIIEAESVPETTGWTEKTSIAGYSDTSYYEWTGPDYFNTPGNGVLEYNVKINIAGTYRFIWRNRIAAGTNNTEHNDSWLRFPDADDFYGQSGAHIVYPGGTGKLPVPNGVSKDGWFKIYMNELNQWSWTTLTSDNDPHQIFVRFNKPGTYKLQVSGRSNGHAIDRMALYHSTVSENDAKDLSKSESKCQGTSTCSGTMPAPLGISGELKKWHKITITFQGVDTKEDATPNPFSDYRLNVTFTNGANTYVVPGYYAADGNAAESSAKCGDRWRVHFSPDTTGTWNYTVSYRKGANIAINDDPVAGTPVTPLDGASGSFQVTPTDKAGRDHRGKGRLRYVGEHYLQFAETGEYFLKGGADAPENFLSYQDFDDTYNHSGANYVKSWSPHIVDWKSGDPVWKGSKGKGIIGALNYLSSKEMNVFSFLTMNVNGDSKDVWPWTSHTERFRFDCSKLDQWEKVFEHADKVGLYLHFKTQETENNNLLDGGAVGIQRKLYYRELIARFSHHLALNWNLGEENTQTTQQRIEMTDYFEKHDPYKHHIVVHTYPHDHDNVYKPLLGNNSKLTGLSIQTAWDNVHKDTKKWITESANAGKKWVVTNDEQGQADKGVTADFDYKGAQGNFSGTDNHNDIRSSTLWGNLMAGGAGVEYYFGYQTGETDLTLQDFRSRNRMWSYTHYALDFFRNYLPFHEMNNQNSIIENTGDDNAKYCLAKTGEVYAVYLKNGGTTNIALPSGNYDVSWYDPRSGGGLQTGSKAVLTGGGTTDVGLPPSDPSKDWAVLIVNQQSGLIKVVSFTLVNADTDTDIRQLNSGDTINLALLPTQNLNIRANTSPAVVGSVVFDYDGNTNYSIENDMPPYALAGDVSGNYNPWTPALGSHILTATPYTATNGGGISGTPLMLSFFVTDVVNSKDLICLTSSAPVIDGTLDALWEMNSRNIVNLALGTGNPSASDLSASFKIMWDAQNLYVYATVMDDILNNSSSSAEFWKNDGIEIFLDGNNEKNTTYDGNDRQFGFVWGKNAVQFPNTANNIFLAQKNISGGYVMEIRIPWSDVGGSTFVPGKIIGFDIHVNDSDDGMGRKQKLAWHATVDESWRNPSYFGELILKGNPCLSLTEVHNNIINNVNIYPNPVNETLIIEGIELMKSELIIYNILGEKLYRESCNSSGNVSSKTIQTGHLPPGIYYLEIKSEDQRTINKFIKN